MTPATFGPTAGACGRVRASARRLRSCRQMLARSPADARDPRPPRGPPRTPRFREIGHHCGCSDDAVERIEFGEEQGADPGATFGPTGDACRRLRYLLFGPGVDVLEIAGGRLAIPGRRDHRLASLKRDQLPSDPAPRSDPSWHGRCARPSRLHHAWLSPERAAPGHRRGRRLPRRRRPGPVEHACERVSTTLTRAERAADISRGSDPMFALGRTVWWFEPTERRSVPAAREPTSVDESTVLRDRRCANHRSRRPGGRDVPPTTGAMLSALIRRSSGGIMDCRARQVRSRPAATTRSTRRRRRP